MFESLNQRSKVNSGYRDGIRFRIVFATPFFELEVSNGYQSWQTVCAQTPNVSLNKDGEKEYCELQFNSYRAAKNYAESTLDLCQERPGPLTRFFRSITRPASKTRRIAHMSYEPVPPPAPRAVTVHIEPQVAQISEQK